ncbi:uncharacterized protein GVI51_J00407 [Nakaseomyces glabratus]|uniref:ATP-dependent DNA helicase RRM3 n=1 Tax=Candida glabrata (strain ATCC 2001 / BCRC 20586 / JCM 3761 / NBRC 0622 / NRRL Y-65 / CBS 138) TaxID=284593 RepID=Q6FPW0_CANGA|nr:uncharacterized protein CAGL0J00517g [Nakaseomyces glabratus]KAH7599001.1 PIF1-like helicase [Nakaseomyces glabratus]KAH7603579.1 PIF1-like helicase [Nakaseomyces glabratus]QHS67386.1 uncharacterized protein GVI51_J00407 [Nakaseomyces glabratus]CAG60681.1 unnamed protein product [Nakaseomyces glabratus]|eukprot:XP_447734.1 uncharacterized protein CAGL0J00517g [[Candida] glabrata]
MRRQAKKDPKQKSINSFFFKAAKSKSLIVNSSSRSQAHSTLPSSQGSSRSDGTSFGSGRVMKQRSTLTKSNLFTFQGSFNDEDCNPQNEFRKLMNPQEINNFKTPSLSRMPSFTRSNSSMSLSPVKRTTTVLSSDDEFREVTTFQSQDAKRQLSFTSSVDTSAMRQHNNLINTNNDLANFSGLKFRKLKAPNQNSNKKSTSSPYGKPLISLTKEQQTVVDYVVKKNMNVFYTGSAGTGKSVILRTIIDKLSSMYGKESIAITASTGLAANTIGGSTLHKWSSCGIGNKSVDHLVRQIRRYHDQYAIWRHTKVLIIDEISMLDGHYLDKLEAVAKQLRNNDRPFGGIQLVLTGDFFQLPPVSKKDDDKNVVFCFDSKMWKKCIQKTILLTKVFRQQDNELVDILNAIRYGELQNDMIKRIKSLGRDVYYPDGISPTELFPTRREVDISNSRQLEALPGEAKIYESVDVAPPSYQNMLDNSVMAEKKLTLKEDAQVMMLKNKPESELFNGTLGRVLFFSTEKLIRRMKELYGSSPLDEDLITDMRLVSRVIARPDIASSERFMKEVNMRPMERFHKLQTMINDAVTTSIKEQVFPYVKWSLNHGRYNYELMLPERFPVDIPGDKLGLERNQLPLMLCWALSIHKAQGQTIQRLRVDLKNIFESGQVYVALSRAISMDSLQVLNFNPKKISIDPKVKEFYRQLEILDT